MIQNYINHIVFVVDASGSMKGLARDVVRVFDNQIKYLSQRSQELNQETRVSVYLFSYSYKIECLIYDMDVMRLPSLSGYYKADGQTALIDAVLKAIYELGKTPELYGDHAFLIYTLTDGQENHSKSKPVDISRAIVSLPENWTLGVMVPDLRGVFEAKKFGFPAENVEVWDSTSVKGLEEAGRRFTEATEGFFTMRSQGIRGSRSLFRPDIKVTPSQVKKSLDELNPSEYVIYRVSRESQIRDFVESKTRRPYVKGSAYYQLVERTRPHKIQDYKQIVIRDTRSGRLYTGDNARVILGLPDYEVKVKPGDFQNFDVFVQSTSVNRKLTGGTDLVVMR
jgi:hypothetical protein